MNRASLLFVFTFLYSFQVSNGCDCQGKGPLQNMRNHYIQNSDIIFLGETISTDSVSGNFSMRVIEIFKGSFSDTIIFGREFDSCSLMPSDFGMWIIYANYHLDYIIDISICSPSRSDSDPMCINCYDIPAPPPVNPTKAYISKSEIKHEELKQKAMNDWRKELEYLKALQDK